MLTFTRSISMAVAVTLGAALSLSSAIPAFAEPASNAAMQSASVSSLHTGDFVRMRAGGPLMTVTDIQGDQVNCAWTDWDGQPQSSRFSVALLQGPITAPADDPSVRQDEQTADQLARKHCPSGVLSIEGQFECAY
jgi:uncharacterized protein YodC (DUF2158 family)